MKKLFSLILFCLCVTATFQAKAQFVSPNETEKLITDRFEYIRNIKKYIGRTERIASI